MHRLLPRDFSCPWSCVILQKHSLNCYTHRFNQLITGHLSILAKLLLPPSPSLILVLQVILYLSQWYPPMTFAHSSLPLLHSQSFPLVLYLSHYLTRVWHLQLQLCLSNLSLHSIHLALQLSHGLLCTYNPLSQSNLLLQPSQSLSPVLHVHLSLYLCDPLSHGNLLLQPNH